VDVARLHWDMTSISLYGAYEEPEEGFIAPRFGHPKDRRPDLKQVQTSLGVSGDGGVPVFHRAYDGAPPIIPQPPPLQARLLHLLDVDPTQPS
jgi:transposase